MATRSGLTLTVTLARTTGANLIPEICSQLVGATSAVIHSNLLVSEIYTEMSRYCFFCCAGGRAGGPAA